MVAPTEHVDTRLRGPAITPFGAIADVARRAAASTSEWSWPSPKYATDPIGFVRDVLPLKLTPAIEDFLLAIRDHRNTTWRSGHKTGKTTGFAAAALWFFCSFERACVPVLAVKEDQIAFGVYKELRRLYRGARVPIGGELHQSCRAGLVDPRDDRKIWGLTAQKPEAVQGISGPNVLVLVDECSGVPDPVLEAVGTSTAGSGGLVRLAYAGNPTRTSGAFYRSHHSEKAKFKVLHTSSEDTPNARGATGDDVVPGLAGPEWIAEWKANPGEDAPEYAIRVKGEFNSGFEGKIIPVELYEMAEGVWDATEFAGQLQIGIDPAGDKTEGDASAMAVRRGLKVLTVITWRGLTTDAQREHAIGLLNTYRVDREPKPRICIDAEGVLGNDLEVALRAYLLRHPDAFELVVFRGSRKLAFAASKYDLARDKGYAEFREWCEAGGAIPTDSMLRQDLTTPDFRKVTGKDGRERLAATKKADLRKALGRSPDKGDAVLLSVWGWQGVASAAEEDQAAAASPTTVAPAIDDDAYDDAYETGDRTFNPYGGAG